MKTLKKLQVHKKSLLIFGIISNIALLGYFKYTDFFIENFNLVFDSSVPLLHLALTFSYFIFYFSTDSLS